MDLRALKKYPAQKTAFTGRVKMAFLLKQSDKKLNINCFRGNFFAKFIFFVSLHPFLKK
jgi:hypothetical protein